MNGELYKIETNNFVKNTITLTDIANNVHLT